MKILRQKEFGKYDKQLAERQGISVEALRSNRAGFEGTGTVNDIINARSGVSGNVSTEFGANSDLSDFKQTTKKGLNRGVQNVNEQRLQDYKSFKQKRGGNSSKAYKKLNNVSEARMDVAGMNDVKLTQDLQKSRLNSGNFGTQNTRHTSYTPSKTSGSTSSIAPTVENITKKTTEKAANPSPIAANKSGSIMSKVSGQWNKMGTLGKVGTIAAGTAAVGGLAYGGYKLLGDGKKKEEKTYSVLLTEEEYKLFCELIENN